jgi:hypothetical protein
MGGPAYGQESVVGGCFGASHAMEHAPVGTVGSLAVGLKHGAQRSVAAHVDSGSALTSEATRGMHVERHRPSEPATDVHEGGSPSPPEAMNGSGTQYPSSPPSPPPSGPAVGHRVSWDCSAAGTSEPGTQCDPAHAGVHSAKLVGSIFGGPT